MPKLKTVNGIDIFVNESGKFEATVDGKLVKRTTLTAVENAITDRIEPLIAFEIMEPYHSYVVRPVSIAKFNRHGQAVTAEGKKFQTWHRVYMCTPADLKKLHAIMAKQSKLLEEWNEIVGDLTQVTGRTFYDLVEKQKNSTKDKSDNT